MDETKKEIASIIAIILIMALIICIIDQEFKITRISLAVTYSSIIILVAVFSKKMTARVLDIKIKHKILLWQRWWITKATYINNPLPIGLIIPILLAWLSGGAIKFFGMTEYESEALPSKSAKRFGLKRYSNVLDWDNALVSFYSLITLIILAAIAKIMFNWSSILEFKELSKLAVIYVISNSLPLSRLDGSRIFFGSRPLFIFYLVILAIAGTLLLI